MAEHTTSPRPRRGSVAALALLAALLATVAAVVGPTPSPAGAAITPVATPGDTSQISLVSTLTTGGWTYAFYENQAYPCADTGYYTFTVASPVGTGPEDVMPLWVYMHGGGFGYFDSNGDAVPGLGQMNQESASDQRSYLANGDTGDGGVLRKVRASGDYRMLAVSMCGHDGYAGGGQTDPNNPHGHTVHGLHATTAAITYAPRTVMTDDVVLHGSSAGAFGVWGVAWALEEQGQPVDALVADSGMIGEPRDLVTPPPAQCPSTGPGRTAFFARVHPDIVDPDNAPAELVAGGRLSAAILDVWSPNDSEGCGDVPVECPLPGGTVNMGAADCLHEPMRLALAAQPGGRSRSMALCVDDLAVTGDCDRHVPTTSDESYRNTELTQAPADFQVEVLDWVDETIDDAEALPSAPLTSAQAFAMALATDLLDPGVSATTFASTYEAIVRARAGGQYKQTVAEWVSTSLPGLERTVIRSYTDILTWTHGPSTAYWVGQLDAGSYTVLNFEVALYASADFAPGSTTGQWVSALYLSALGFAAGPGDVTYWSGQVASRGKAAVARDILQSTDGANRRIKEIYLDLLGRAATSTDLSTWRSTVQTLGDRGLIVRIVPSTEYQTRSDTRFP